MQVGEGGELVWQLNLGMVVWRGVYASSLMSLWQHQARRMFCVSVFL